jgi:flagellar hook-basal body complex protein FliE
MNIVTAPQTLADLVPIHPQDAGAPSQGGFAQVLEQVDGILQHADQLAAGYAQGQVGLTEAVLASEKADTTFLMVMALRNRALAAYQEVMNLQV